MKALRLQVLHTCDGSPSLSVNTTRNSDPKWPRRLVCFASTVNRLVACFASSSERQKRQRYFKTILLHAEVVYFPRIFRVFFRYICLLHTSINYTENVRIFTRMRKQWIPGALLRFFKRLGTRLALAYMCTLTVLSVIQCTTLILQIETLQYCHLQYHFSDSTCKGHKIFCNAYHLQTLSY